MNSLVGKSAYDIWLSLGNKGTEQDFIASLKGDKGDSAYDIWLQQRHTGTEEDFISYLSTVTWERI